MRTSALFGVKDLEFYGVSARTRGLEPVQTRGFNFLRLC